MKGFFRVTSDQALFMACFMGVFAAGGIVLAVFGIGTADGFGGLVYAVVCLWFMWGYLQLAPPPTPVAPQPEGAAAS